MEEEEEDDEGEEGRGKEEVERLVHVTMATRGQQISLLVPLPFSPHPLPPPSTYCLLSFVLLLLLLNFLLLFLVFFHFFFFTSSAFFTVIFFFSYCLPSHSISHPQLDLPFSSSLPSFYSSASSIFSFFSTSSIPFTFYPFLFLHLVSSLQFIYLYF